MVFSPLIKGYKIATHYRKTPRTVPIDTITIHHMAGNMTAENCVAWLASATAPERSCNYAIGSNGEIWGGVPEENESYCSSDRPNDARAITIEVANDGGEESGWHVSAKAIDSLISLLADICTRYKESLSELRWEADKDLLGNVDRQNITLHKWFSATGCPGPYLESQIPAIVRRVNAKLTPTNDSVFTDQERQEILNLFADFILSQRKKGENNDT